MIEITTELVKTLVKNQFPKWADLPIYPVAKSGHDNRTFHLGNEMMVRLPSSKDYVAQVEKENVWLPKLKPHLSLPITTPVAKGDPTDAYPFPWSINLYVEGETASYDKITDLTKFATDLAMFIKELQCIDTTDGPKAGKHNFFRGGDLAIYNDQTEKALEQLKNILPTSDLSKIWKKALQSKWQHKDVWVHGDIAPGNLLVKDGSLCGVIDFGVMCVGEPSCEYVLAWTFFDKDSRQSFLKLLNVDNGTINRARGWALWKALITYNSENIDFLKNARYTINAILDEYNNV